MPTLGPGIDGFIQEAPLGSLGAGIDGFINAIPSAALGPGIDGFVELLPWPLLRSPQIKIQDLAEDRLQNTTSHQLGSVTGIDLTTIATTTLFTAQADKKALILGVILQVTAADTITTAPQASVGVNPSTTNVFANEVLTGLDAVNDIYLYWSKLNKGVVVGNGGVLDFRVNTAATATSLVATARVIGILV